MKILRNIRKNFPQVYQLSTNLIQVQNVSKQVHKKASDK